MSIKIQNVTNRPVLLRLNSGRTLHLDPRGTSSEIRNVEVKNNAKVQKLQERRIIALHEVKEKKPPTRGPKKNKAEPTKAESDN
ncbi:hypothetical protein KFU94_07975 [Chloroflexi bacterium TSY]|nr:hypothetical protein [Chloroflexi bacterium TSY]